jgi:hypothetical protein
MNINYTSSPAPKPRTKVRRLSREMKIIPADKNKGYELDLKTAKCLVAHGRYRGWIMVQLSNPSGTVTVWRIG